MTWQVVGELPLVGVMPGVGAIAGSLTANVTAAAAEVTAKIAGQTATMAAMAISPPTPTSDIEGLTAFIASLAQTLAGMIAAAAVSPPVPVPPALLVAGQQLLELGVKLAALEASVNIAAEFSASLSASVTAAKFDGTGIELAASGPPTGFGQGRCVAVALIVPEASAPALKAMFGGVL